MKDVYEIFADELQRLTGPDDIGFENCFQIVPDLARIVAYSDFKQGLLVAEVLEGIFSQVEPLFNRYNIPENDATDIKNQIGQGLSLLSSAYRNDYGAAYEIPADLRFAATRFQFRALTTRRLLKPPYENSGGAT